MHDSDSREVWTTVEVNASRLRRNDRGVQSTLELSGLSPSHRVVKDREVDGAKYRVFEQVNAATYHHRSADRIVEVVNALKSKLWHVISSTPPYRRYYLYLSPSADRSPLPQICSSYALMFFLGSLTRYHPSYLFDVMNGSFGAFFREFVATQPQQLLVTIQG